MLLLHFNLAAEFGGGEVQTLNLLQWLDQRGIEQAIIVKKNSPFALRLGKDFPRIRILSVIDVIKLLAVNSGTENRVLLHAHDGRSIHICSYLKTFFGVPFVTTRRVDKGLPSNIFSQRSYKNADRLIAVSSPILNRLKAGLGAEVCNKIPDSFSGFSIDKTEVNNIRERFDGKRLIGQIGSLYKIKGHKFTISAAQKLEQTRPDLHFVILGSGDERSCLEELAGELSNLTFVGFVEDVGNWLAALDLLVHPSLKEGLGSILLEAQQFGVPVIASDVGGIPDVVLDGETGLLVPAGDSEALRDAITRLIDNPDLRAKLIDGASKHLEKFTPDAVGEAYLNLYQDVLAGS